MVYLNEEQHDKRTRVWTYIRVFDNTDMPEKSEPDTCMRQNIG